MSNDELYAEILRFCLFDKNRRENPGGTFQRRLNDGDYLPVQPDEDPDSLRSGHQPMTDNELDAEVMRVCADSVYWDGYSHAAAKYIVRNGDFRPLQIDEDPDDLPPLREPMDEVGLVDTREQAELDSMYWAGNTWLSTNGVISSVILRS